MEADRQTANNLHSTAGALGSGGLTGGGEMETCRWFVLCENEAVLRITHPAYPDGVPVCRRCADRFALTGESIRLQSEDDYEVRVVRRGGEVVIVKLRAWSWSDAESKALNSVTDPHSAEVVKGPKFGCCY